ncbi:phosphoadenosine phosphosulfate reductase family protein [Paenibacillus vini]|uniref:phosphoadenosine phosphosulfate reductase domain-containing protein n=1 Tax=Paenibacillus vini TaxID=1476024 RepID=UPI0025B6E10E|nr:phosphoadenosine phosphosulfate reductase family protein [Paenibacillus vini]MDN4067513.1 phosphoadenosine phosphosulfate reductase family protein [Paenibacillus vini]
MKDKYNHYFMGATTSRIQTHIIFFSGGLSSFAVADYVKTNYPDDNILLYFTDTLWEHPDLYRFIQEASDKLKLPLLIHSSGLNPIQLMFEKKLVFNNMIGECSKILKMRVAADFLKRKVHPKIEKWINDQYLVSRDFPPTSILYFGIGWDEIHRQDSIIKNWRPFKVEMPLINNIIRTDEVLKKYDINKPELYNLGFTHNNCHGRCIKAGQGHNRLLKHSFPEIFNKHMEEEYHISMYTSSYRYISSLESDGRDGLTDEVKEKWLIQLDDAYRDYFYGAAEKPKLFIHPAAGAVDIKIKQYSYMKRQSKEFVTIEKEDEDGNKYSVVKNSSEPYPLRFFNADEQKRPEQIDLFDIGGCGCFVQFD